MIGRKKIGIVFCFLFLSALFFGIRFRFKKMNNKEKISGEKNNYSQSLNFSLIRFKDSYFKAEIAQTFEERKQGLMFRKDLAEDEAMLFIFENEETHQIWMKNTLVPLDIIWLDKNMEAVSIKENALPCQSDPCPVYKNSVPAKYVLELKAGKVKELDLKIGEKMQFSN